MINYDTDGNPVTRDDEAKVIIKNLLNIIKVSSSFFGDEYVAEMVIEKGDW